MSKKNKINISIIMLLAIIALGTILRIYNISDNPIGFFCDEASNGYDAYSLLTTGKDQHGVSFPMFFESFKDYKSGLAIYFTIPSIGLFGLNEFSTRLPSAILGIIEIIIMFFIGKELSKNKKNYYGLLAALITAPMPWLIHYNRIEFELTSYATFFSLTILLFLKSIQNKKLIILTFIIAAMTLYTYQPAKLLVPLLLLGFLVIHRKTYLHYGMYSIIGSTLFLIISIPLMLSFINGTSFERLHNISIINPNLTLHESIRLFIQNYFIQLSPSYFISGEPTFITRHFINGLTPLLIVTLPFILIGLIHILAHLKNNKNYQLIIYLILIYPLAGAVTATGPFTGRSIIGAPLFAILTSIGIIATIFYAKKFIYRHMIIAIISGLIFINLCIFTKFYFTQYPLHSADFWGWQYGARSIINYFNQNEKKYDELIMIPEFNSPNIFFKFYSPNGCSKCKTGVPHESYNREKKQLFSITPKYMKNHNELTYNPIKKIYYPNGEVAFILTEIISK